MNDAHQAKPLATAEAEKWGKAGANPLTFR